MVIFDNYKYKRIEVKLRNPNGGISIVEFSEVEMSFINSFMIIKQINEDKTVTCNVYPLNTIVSYKLH